MYDGAILYHGGVPASTYGASWPATVPLQLHLSEHDAWSELDVARALARDAAHGELFVYPGSGHLIADPGLASYDPSAAVLIIQRTISFLDRWR